jgi:hypothetical protein
METINENTTCTIQVNFWDEDGVAITPDSASYVLYDKFSGTSRGSGAIGSLATSVNLTLSTTENRILDQNNRYEIAVAQVSFAYGTKSNTQEYQYKISNLSYLA